MRELTFEQAVSIVERASDPNKTNLLTTQELLRVNEASAILAKEYLSVRNRIAPPNPTQRETTCSTDA